MNSLSHLGHLSITEFLTGYWQKKPVVLRDVFPDFTDYLSPEELAGLALEDDVESRIIQQTNDEWHAEQGPFDESTFTQLPDKNWTLLIQTFEHWFPESRTLLEAFRFIPDWRRDDLMVSFAAPGGSVGAHIDQYDVFLVQGLGSRHWQVGEPHASTKPHRPHPLLSLIEPFNPIIDVELTTGDVLYIPPNTAHWGVAKSECLTYSVGFRAPSQKDVLEQVLINLMDSPSINNSDTTPNVQSMEQRWTDDVKKINASTAQLPNTAPWVRQSIDHLSDDNLQIAFGQLVTRLKYPIEPASDKLTFQSILQTLNEETFESIDCHDESRVCYADLSNDIALFINGDVFRFSPSHQLVIEQLANSRTISKKTLKKSMKDVDFVTQIANLVLDDCLNFKHD